MWFTMEIHFPPFTIMHIMVFCYIFSSFICLMFIALWHCLLLYKTSYNGFKSLCGFLIAVTEVHFNVQSRFK